METKPIVEKFESSANQRSVGTVNGHDLSAMKTQLGKLSSTLATCMTELAAKQKVPAAVAPVKKEVEPPVVVEKIYPTIPAPETTNKIPVLVPPVTPGCPSAVTAPPEGIVDDIDEIVKTISALVKQITTIFGAIAKIEGSESSSVATVAPAVAPVAVALPEPIGPKFSRTLPGMEPIKSKKDGKKDAKEAKKDAKEAKKAAKKAAKIAKEAGTKKALPPIPVAPVEQPKVAPSVEPVKPLVETTKPSVEQSTAPVVALTDTSSKSKEGVELAIPEFPSAEVPKISPTPEMIKSAHDKLDEMIKKGIVDSPIDLIVMSEDEAYCVKKFRAMVVERQGEMTKNFIHRFDKLCKRS